MRTRLGISAALAALFAVTACDKGQSDAAAATSAAPAAPATAIPAGSRLVPITASDQGFSPASVPAKKGEHLVLRFTRTTSSECLKAIALPELGIKKDLPMNTPVDVPVTVDKEGKVVFQCWMAMFKGSIDVSGS